MKDLSIEQLVAKHGAENLRFLVALRPLRKMIFFAYTSTSDPEEMKLCRIVEERYKLSENYKVELKAEDTNFGKQSFYVMDLNSLLRQGQIRVFVEL